MPIVRIQGVELPYEETDIISFPEGLIGMPRLRRMVLVRQTDVEPFLWLASLDDERIAFLVVDPRVVVADYAPEPPEAVRDLLGVEGEERAVALAIMLVAPEWTESTVNLRAPIFVAASTMRGVQAVLHESPYGPAHRLPLAAVA